MIIKLIIIALVVLKVSLSVYSMFSYAWCSSYLLVHDKPYQRLPAADSNPHIPSHGFCGLGIGPGSAGGSGWGGGVS